MMGKIRTTMSGMRLIARRACPSGLLDAITTSAPANLSASTSTSIHGLCHCIGCYRRDRLEVLGRLVGLVAFRRFGKCGKIG